MKKITLIIVVMFLLSVVVMSSAIEYTSVSASSFEPNVSGKSYIVVDNNGFVLLEKNSEDRKPVASICKLMTTLITLENIENENLTLDDKVIASEYACSVEGSQAFLDPGSEYTIRDLLKSVIVASANDSAIVLAESIAGSEDSFVDMMNSKAQELGMNNTLYANSTGLDDKINQYSTAKDTAIILNEVSKYPIYREDCKIWMDKLVHPSGRETELVNTNRLIKYFAFCETGKTGYTSDAGYCLSSTASKNNLKLTCVVLGCETSADRFTDSVALYNYTYANFQNKKVIDKNTLLESKIKVSGGKENNCALQYKEDMYLTFAKNQEMDFEIKTYTQEELKAPVVGGEIVGYAEVVVDGNIVGQVDIVTANNIERQTFKDIINKIAEQYSFVK